MRNYLFVIGALLFSAVSLGFIIDEEPLKKIVSNLETFRKKFPQEKVHLHLDKPYYAIGDSIWFKAYVVEAEKNMPTNKSKVLYVDLINEKDLIVKSLKLQLMAGLGWGDFPLPDTLQAGNYRLRAYTNWMRNFGNEYFFDKTLAIGNAVSNNIVTDVKYTLSQEGQNEKITANISYRDMNGVILASKPVSYQVFQSGKPINGSGITDDKGVLQLSFINNNTGNFQSKKITTQISLNAKSKASASFPVNVSLSLSEVTFFPEGGELVEGIRSKIAFKALGVNGKSVNISGNIVDNENTIVTSFKSEHAGVGILGLLPQTSKKYTAIVKFDDGSEKRIQLPDPKGQGYVLSVNNNDPENLLVKVSASENLLNKGDITIVGQSNGIIHYMSKNAMNSPVLSASVPKSRFPNGILQLTLFSAESQPIAERIVFINRTGFLQITPSLNKTSYGSKEKVNLALDVKNSKGEPVTGSFSVSVVDETKVPFKETDEHTIMSDLLLTSDLKGYIERPNYYFTNSNETTNRHLDYLMLTQGWRRFTWKDILTEQYPVTAFQAENNMNISGRVLTFGGKPLAKSKISLFSSAGSLFLIDTLTDEDGKFNFTDLIFKDSTRFIVQARSSKDKKYVDIKLDPTSSQSVSPNKNYPDFETNVNQSILAYLKNSTEQYKELRRINSTISLDEVKITAEKKPIISRSGNLNGPGMADHVILGNQIENCFNILQCIANRTSGIKLEPNGKLYMKRSMNNTFDPALNPLQPMSIVLDGIMISQSGPDQEGANEFDILQSYNSNDIESIEILKSTNFTTIYGTGGYGGVLIINTKIGAKIASATPGLIKYTPKGFYPSREFYSPNYKSGSSQPDLRTTIYWNPQVIVNNGKNMPVEYFNAAGKGTYKIIIEGIDADGNIGRTLYNYKVN
ncbi:MAG TPA: hypothetical protein VNI52_04490 [Sphingobacteriaceae bacterium]|nr:hypothetical protein [Sphingobacteriaceae bacterium]